MATIKIHGKTSDCCVIEYINNKGEKIIVDGYTPEFATDDKYGSDYISLEINTETGQILDWERRKKDLDEYIAGLENPIEE